MSATLSKSAINASLNFSSERVEYYRNKGEILEVKTCACCCHEGNYDAWSYKKGVPVQSVGVSLPYLSLLKLITRRDAEKQVAQMGHALHFHVVGEGFLTEPEKLWAHVQAFIEKHDIHHPETVYQSDRVIQNGYEFIDGCCAIVGYKPAEDED